MNLDPSNPDSLVSPVAGLQSNEALPETEATMLRLATGDRVELAGTLAADVLRSGGKRLRARLALASGEALGLERSQLVPWAAACELLHNATLVHDDIQDGDRVRRGQTTTWAAHGVGQAINVGDLMLMLPLFAVGETAATPAMKARLYDAVAVAAVRTARGQASEMALVSRDDVSWHDWVWAAEGKSGALLGLPAHGAAVLAGLDDATCKALGRAFTRTGVLYQLQDDLLDLTPLKGKARVASDLVEGKVNALVVAHLALFPEERAAVLAWLRAPERVGVEDFVARLRSEGAVALVQQQVEVWSRATLDDATLRAIPSLHAVAQALVARVRRAAQTSTSEGLAA